MDGRDYQPFYSIRGSPLGVAPTGIDYLRLVAADRETQRSQGINFTAITGNDRGGSR